MFPIDPTPYVNVYAVIVFLCPWLIFASWVVRHTLFIRRVRPSWFWWFGFAQWKEYAKFREQNPEAMAIWRGAMRWLMITAICWAIGLVVLAGTLFFMDRNDLLINHSKGIYGRDEVPEHQTP